MAVKMNIRSAVLYSEVQINSTKDLDGFFIETEFGKVGMEINPSQMIDPFHPVMLLTWQQSPDTPWALANKSAIADYYVAINIFGSTTMDHMAIIEAFSRVMLKDSGFGDPDDNIIQAMISCYMNNYDCQTVTINMLVSDYIHTHMNMVPVKDKIMLPVQSLVREVFQQKIDAGADVLSFGNDLYRLYKDNGELPETNFIDSYSEDIFKIFLYAKMKKERNLDDIIRNISRNNNVTPNTNLKMLSTTMGVIV
jgi:hypothetical protein